MQRQERLPTRIRLACGVILILTLILALPACDARHGASAGPASTPPPPDPPWFEEVTAKLGLDFKHDAGVAGDYFMPESIGSGGALFDFDNDGRLDLYLIHNVPASSPSKNRLFRQQPDGTFRDVSAGSGLDVAGHGMGVTAGDLTNDGLPEVFVTEFGRVRLFLNQGGGRFEDVTGASGLANDRWATASAFFDYDRDGWLDVVVGNYVDYSATVPCHDTVGAREYCGPQGMEGTACRLFRNLGGEGSAGRSGGVRFEDVTAASGLARRTGAALGMICADFDGDRWPDIFIADDGMPNRLFINQRDGRFLEEAALRGIAYNAFGSTAANMGVARGDVDGDGLADVFVTHVSWELHALWVQGPAGVYQDQIVKAGLAGLDPRGTGFGTVLADFDLDGDEDLAFVNGRIKRGDDAGELLGGVDEYWRPYAQGNQLLANDGTGRFRDISASNRALCGRRGMGRGLACGDFDNDGRPDLVVMNAGGPVQLLRNVAPAAGHWLGVRAVDPALGGRDAIGAEVSVHAAGRRWRRLVQPSHSYLVSNDPRVHFGLGPAAVFDGIEVVWPDGVLETFPGGSCDRLMVLGKGSGRTP